MITFKDMSVELELGDHTYGLRIPSYFPGSRGSYWQPPDDPELEIDRTVTVDGRDRLSYETFLELYAQARGITGLELAETRLEQEVMDILNDEIWADEPDC